MSELDLGSTPTAATTTPAAPAPVQAPGGLVLQPPAPVPAVKEEEAAGAIPVPDAKKAELAQRAEAFANELAAMDHRAPDFAKRIDTITSMGDKDLRASAAVSNRMLDRPAAVVRAGKGGGGGDAQTRVAGTLVDLRSTITDLDPNRADLTGARKVLKWLPGGDRLQRYFQKYE